MSLPNDIVPDRDEARRRQAQDPLLGSAAAAADAAGLACPDAELLGLYAERALSRPEAAALEAHVQACARCHDVVEAIARATPDAVAAAGTREPGSAGATGVAGWFGGWRWLVPAVSLAGATAVAFWLGRSPAPDMELARTDAAPAARPVPQPAEPARDALAPEAQGAASFEAQMSQATPRVSPGGRTAANAETAARKSLPEAFANDSAMADAAGGAANAAAPAAEPARPADTAGFAPPAPASPATSAAARVASAESPSPAAAAPQTAERLREERSRPATLGRAPQAEPPAPADAGAGAAAQGAADFRAPYTRWRVRDGVLEFARDGRTWRRVTLPTTERLATVVERPDATVLVVTVSGVEFVSTDRGATWERQ